MLIPEPLSDRLPVAGRGQACWKVTIRRDGPPVHEVMRPHDAPRVIAAGASWSVGSARWTRGSRRRSTPSPGDRASSSARSTRARSTTRIPPTCRLEGTRRWIPGAIVARSRPSSARSSTHWPPRPGPTIEADFQLVRDAFALDPDAPFVADFQAAYDAIAGAPLPTGPKPFVDDGNSVWALTGVPAITHGPRAGGQHTVEEWASIDDLVRVARLYALTAALFCPRG